MTNNTDKSDNEELSKAQERVVDALRQPKAYMVQPYDSPGKRTGYVTTDGLRGYVCPVKLSTFKILERKGLIAKNFEGDYYRIVNPS